jgi:hypothetical protein
MLRAALPRLVEHAVKLYSNRSTAGQRGRSVKRCCWALGVLSEMFTASRSGDE